MRQHACRNACVHVCSNDRAAMASTCVCKRLRWAPKCKGCGLAGMRMAGPCMHGAHAASASRERQRLVQVMQRARAAHGTRWRALSSHRLLPIMITHLRLITAGRLPARAADTVVLPPGPEPTFQFPGGQRAVALAAAVAGAHGRREAAQLLRLGGCLEGRLGGALPPLAVRVTVHGFRARHAAVRPVARAPAEWSISCARAPPVRPRQAARRERRHPQSWRHAETHGPSAGRMLRGATGLATVAIDAAQLEGPRRPPTRCRRRLARG